MICTGGSEEGVAFFVFGIDKSVTFHTSVFKNKTVPDGTPGRLYEIS
jgi:hypothetical protein